LRSWLGLPHQLADLRQLPAACERARVRGRPRAHDKGHRVAAGGKHEFLELAGILALGLTGNIQVNEHSAFARIGTVKKQDYLFRSGSTGDGNPASTPVSGLTGAFVIVRRILQAHDPGRDNRGNRVFVDHLADSIFQQHHKLIERFNLTLQFYAINQINGNRYTFLAQNIQIRVL
jgi:hypothetical protein